MAQRQPQQPRANCVYDPPCLSLPLQEQVSKMTTAMSDDAQRNAPNRSSPRHWRDAENNCKIQIVFMDTPLQDNASNKKLFTALTTAQKTCDGGTGRA